MRKLIRIQIAKILLVSMLITQSSLLQSLGAVIAPSGDDRVEKDIELTDTYISEGDIPESSILEDYISESETSEREEDISESDVSKEESKEDEKLEDIEFEETESVKEPVEDNQKEPFFTEIATPSNVSKPKDFISEEDFSEHNTVQIQQKIPSIEIATPSNAYKSKAGTGVWDGISEKEVIPTGNIYNIQQPEELAWVKTVTNDGTENFAGKTLIISNDLDMGGYEWEGIGNFDNPFMGSVDGNNYTISGIKQENQTSSMGMFGVIEVQNDLVIRNLIIENIELSGNATFAGILAGYIKLKRLATFNMENVETSGIVDVSGCSFAGGLVGNIYSPNNADVNIKNIKTSGDMTIVFSALNNSVTNTGGLIGCYDNPYGSVNIKDSSSTMNIDTTAQNSAGMYTGGIFGSSNGGQIGFNRVYATGVLKGQAYDKCIGGGLIGSCETNELKINNSYMANMVELNAINSWAGGLVGFLKCKITYGDSFFRNCHVSGELKARQCAAFIVQNDSATESVLVDYCYYNKSNQGLNTEDKKITNLGFFETTRIDCPNGYGIVDSEMGEESSFVGWDFDNVWGMQGSGYPELQENVSLYEGLIAGMDSEEIVYSNLKGAYETEEFDLNYGYQIDGEVISEEWIPDIALAQVKITLPEGFSFSRDEQITEMYVNDGEAPLDYVYALKDEGKSGKVKVFVDKELERKEYFRVRISISAEGFEAVISYSDIATVLKEERPLYVPEEAIYNKFNGHWYCYYKDVYSWEESLNECTKRSGYLVTITSEAEESFIKSMIEEEIGENAEFNEAWIGLYYYKRLDKWTWVSGEKFEYRNWINNDLDKKGDSLYAILTKDYQWNYLNKGTRAYICEWSLEKSLETEFNRYIYQANSLLDLSKAGSNTVKKRIEDDTPCEILTIAAEKENLDCIITFSKACDIISTAIDDPMKITKFVLEPKDIYSAIIMNILEAEVDFEFFNSQHKKMVKDCGKYISVIERDMQELYGIDVRDLNNYNNLTYEEKKKFAERTSEFFETNYSKFSEIEKKFSIAEKVIDYTGDIRSYYEYCVSVMMLSELSESTKSVVKQAYKESMKTGNVYLQQALRECESIIDSSTSTLIENMVLKGEMILGEKSFEYLWTELIWKDIKEKFTIQCPEAAVLQAAYRTGKVISNLLTNTDKISEQYVKMEAVVQVDKVFDEAYNTLQTKFKFEQSEESAKEYLSALSLVFKCRDKDCIEASKFIEIVDSALVSKLLGISHAEGINTIRNYQNYYFDAYELAQTEWVYDLDVDYPEAGLYETYEFLFDESKERKLKKKWISACPVDVYVYDSQDNLVAYVEKNIISCNGDLTIALEGDVKTVYFYEDTDDYYIKYVGNDTGNMDVTVKEYEEGEEIRTINFYDIELENGTIYEADVTSNRYELKDAAGGSVIPNYDSEKLNMDSYTISVEGGSLFKVGKLFFSTEATVDETIEISAYLPENTKFIRWEASNGKDIFKSSTQPNTTLRMPDENITVRAITESDSQIFYTVTFDFNGGNTIHVQRIRGGEKAQEPTIPVREGYHFIGWYCNGIKYDFSSIVSKDLILEARWEENNNRYVESNGTGGQQYSRRSKYSRSEGLPSYVISGGTWIINEMGKWQYINGRVYINEWAVIENPYANIGAGQQAFDWFRFDENGFMVTGWFTDEIGDTYYLNPISDGTCGRMLTGWQLIDEKWYYFNPMSNGKKGKMFADIWIGNYYLNPLGIWEEDKQKNKP